MNEGENLFVQGGNHLDRVLMIGNGILTVVSIIVTVISIVMMLFIR